MTNLPHKTCTAFEGLRCIANGALPEVALAVREALARDPAASILVFDDATGGVVDLDLRGTADEIAARLGSQPAGDGKSTEGPAVAPGRGRPKLGVVAREVTLLPRHWAWLSAQPGGASNALRRLAEKAMRDDGGTGQARAGREAAYRFMSALAGDLPGYEEAIRALFAGDRTLFEQHVSDWPADIRSHAVKLGWRDPPDAQQA